jgi:hypothetical protein
LELSVFLNAKLCRRIAKLEVDKHRVSILLILSSGKYG